MYAGRDRRGGAGGRRCSRGRATRTRAASWPRSRTTSRRAGCAASPGVAVGVGERPPGCAFAPRCPQRVDALRRGRVPPLEEIGPATRVRCFEWRRTPPLGREPVRRRAAASAGAAPLLAVEGLRAEHRTRTSTVVAARRRLVRRRAAASASRSSASRAAARRRSPAASPACTRPPAGAIVLDGDAARRRAPASARVRRGGASRSSSRTPTTRSTRATPSRDAIARPAAHPARALAARGASAEVAALLERVRLPARARRPLPARALRRRAPARRDRPRARGPARAARLRRGHLGARRLRAGRRARAAGGAARRARARAALHLARPRRRGERRGPRARARPRRGVRGGPVEQVLVGAAHEYTRACSTLRPRCRRRPERADTEEGSRRSPLATHPRARMRRRVRRGAALRRSRSAAPTLRGGPRALEGRCGAAHVRVRGWRLRGSSPQHLGGAPLRGSGVP